MSDLISRSALIEALQKDKEAVYSHVFCHTDCQHEDELFMDLEQLIINQPTAYDPEEVASILKEERDELEADWQKYDTEDDFGGYCAMDRAIKIVRNGGKA